MQEGQRLGIFDLVCLGLNCVIGGGIFLTVGDVARTAGPAAPWMFLIGGLVCLPIAICFAHMAREFPGTGGSSLYAREAFGPRAGFVVGWVMWMSGVIGGASVAVGFATVLARSGLTQLPAPAVASLIVISLAAINLLGTRSGAWSNNILALLKLGPLIGAALVALIHRGPWALLHPASALPPPGDWATLQAGLLGVLYTYSGFEEIVLPSGEARDPEKTVPRATIWVLLFSALLYTVLQGAVCLQGWDQSQPLQASFSEFPWLVQGLSLAALVSLASVNASIAFTSPRSLWTLADQGWLPRPLTRLHHGAPRLCIAISAALTLLLVCLQSLEKLVTLSVLAALLQHFSTSLACLKRVESRRHRGAPWPAIAACLFLLGTSPREPLLGIAGFLALGLVLTSALTNFRERDTFFRPSAQMAE